ncbi:protein eva-1 homolog C isoform X1 [Thunnus thynnus]|uniref:protein eva-1 homolog C isoform X1 n=1 Tax=Thunnus thynnus TaxID=8237 RepID=UPI003527DCBF
MQGSDGPPGGLPPQHSTQLEMHTEPCTALARRSLGLTAVWWEDEGRHGCAHLLHATHSLKLNAAAAAAVGLSNATEKLTNFEASRMFFSDGTVSAVSYALLLGITCLTVLCDFTKGSSDFSGYLSKVLRNYTEQACDGDFLSVRCPPRTTITVQSAFYGRRGASDPQQCPQTYQALLSSYNAQEDDRYCSVSTALQKMLDECQDRRSCQVLVNSRVFGTDQCPGSSKYLIVRYKCRPNEYKSKVVCEEERMRLSCKRGMQIAVYSAMFGRTQQGTLECPLHYRRAPSVDCQSPVALQILTTHCQGKKSCLIRASTRDFGDPCYSGTRKYLSVIYTCVPKKLLQDQNPRPPVYAPPPSAHDPNIVGDSPPEGTSIKSPDTVPDRKRIRETNPNEEKSSETGRGGEHPLQPPAMNPIFNSTPSSNMALISNALAAYTYISDHPERAALFFVCGVCLGLFLTLFALVVQISCRTDCQPRQRPPAKKRARPADSSSDSSDSDSDWDTTSDLSARRHRRFERTLNMNVFTSAEELERAQRLEERERIIREIWMNGQPDIPGTRSLNRYY